MESLIATRTGIEIKKVLSVLHLLNDGATIPFMARYRKEATGGLDEIQIEKIEKEHKALSLLEKRKVSILERLKELGIHNPALLDKINNCYDSHTLEDIYLPYKPKRKTRASMAREKGLEPLAKIIMAQRQNDIFHHAKRFTTKEISASQALDGARDIIAEWISEHSYGRNQLRKLYRNTAVLETNVNKKSDADAAKYQDYFDFNQSIRRIPGHRILAIFRAENEGILKVKINIDKNYAIRKLENIFIKSKGEAANQIKLALSDALKRLLAPSLETEIRNEAKVKADEEAINIFSNNLSQLLLSPPLGPTPVMALDPGFRTGCKLVCLNSQGNLIHHTTIFPHPPLNQSIKAEGTILSLCRKHKIKAIAVGNGTAGRETVKFVKDILLEDTEIEVYSVNEAGASIYSASKTGREEFPNLDLTVRGSISIGRRLIDPLAELVKLDPKNIGVGQYQHDVAQDKLVDSLENTVVYAVNKVGVNLNTASNHLLKFVSGIGPKLAENIIDHRNKQGPFKSRQDLHKVKGLGAKAFEQAAGFLRIKDGTNPLDSSGVHPESYPIVQKMARSNNLQIKDLIGNEQFTGSINLSQFTQEGIGIPTLKEIIQELNKPGLDPRGSVTAVKFDDNITEISDLNPGMKLQGKVTNLTKFGAFVDIGIKENGLVHISQITDRYISDPSEILALNQIVTVVVVDVDMERKRIQLSMKT